MISYQQEEIKQQYFRQPAEREPLIKVLLDELEELPAPGIPDIMLKKIINIGFYPTRTPRRCASVHPRCTKIHPIHKKHPRTIQ